MSTRTLHLTIISAKDLNKVNLVGKMSVYAVVHITGSETHKTHVDKDGDANPTWNHQLKFQINASDTLRNRLTLVINLKAEGLFADKDLGQVHVPVNDLLEDNNYNSNSNKNKSNSLKFVSYQVMKPSGKPKGELNFSYKFDGLDEPTAYPAADTGFGLLYPPPVEVGEALGAYPPLAVVVEPVMYYPHGYGYEQHPAYGVYPPPAYGVYPPPTMAGYGGYEYVYPPQAGYGYGYPPVQQQQQTVFDV